MVGGLVLDPIFEAVFPLSRNRQETSQLYARSFIGGVWDMIPLKFSALVLCAGVLVSLFTPSFDADLVLAILACFS